MILTVFGVGAVGFAWDPESPWRRVARWKRRTPDLVDELVIARLLDVTFTIWGLR